MSTVIEILTRVRGHRFDALTAALWASDRALQLRHRFSIAPAKLLRLLRLRLSPSGSRGEHRLNQVCSFDGSPIPWRRYR